MSHARDTALCMGPYTLPTPPSRTPTSPPATPLYLSAVEFSDIPEMVRLLNLNQDVYHGSALFQYPYLESHAQERIQKAHNHILQTGVNTHFALRLSNDPDAQLIGWAHLHFEHYSEKHPQPVHPLTGKPLKVAEIGYWLSAEQTGHGYAARMAHCLVHQIAMQDMGCDIVRAVSYVENWGSRKVAERAGMTLETESRMIWIPKLKEERAVCCYAIHQDEATRDIKKEDYDY
ncbi:hypothetical protein EDD11_010336 [Mortierella claussenii]|nr:hypothetical protein EDD11_010336 [Mortierella claussenii]